MLLCEERRKLSLFFTFEKPLPGTKHDFLTNKAIHHLFYFYFTGSPLIIRCQNGIGMYVVCRHYMCTQHNVCVKIARAKRGWNNRALPNTGDASPHATINGSGRKKQHDYCKH
jgi:hypothetical protein